MIVLVLRWGVQKEQLWETRGRTEDSENQRPSVEDRGARVQLGLILERMGLGPRGSASGPEKSHCVCGGCMFPCSGRAPR